MIVWLLRRFGRPTPPPPCFGSNPSPQEAAENDCAHCRQGGGVPKPAASSLDFAFGGRVWPGLAKLSEEGGEVQQVLAKLIQTGGDPNHWSGDMVEKLVEELPDLLAAIKVFIALNPALHPHEDVMRERFAMKVEKFLGWHFDTLAARA